MSKTTKRKHVAREVLEDFDCDLKQNQQIVRVVAGRGNNLHEVETSDGVLFLASMPVKFRRNVWIKRGNFVITESIEEGDKVKAEITNILYKKHIRQLKSQNLWPTQFNEDSIEVEHSLTKTKTEADEDSNDGSDAEGEDELFVNTNRPLFNYDDNEVDSGSESETSS